MSQKRKRLMIDPTVQWAVARRVALHWFGFFALLLAVNSLLGMLVEVPEKTIADSAVTSFQRQVPQIVIMLLILPIFLRDTIRLSNKFAGPMYRLRLGLGALADEKPQAPIKFRSSDFWQDVAERFNRVNSRIQSLEARSQSLDSENRRLREELDAAQRGVGV